MPNYAFVGEIAFLQVAHVTNLMFVPGASYKVELYAGSIDRVKCFKKDVNPFNITDASDIIKFDFPSIIAGNAGRWAGIGIPWGITETLCAANPFAIIASAISLHGAIIRVQPSVMSCHCFCFFLMYCELLPTGVINGMNGLLDSHRPKAS